MKSLKEHIEKAVKEFVYPATLPTQEDIDFVVTPVMEAINAWLNDYFKHEKRYDHCADCQELIKRLQRDVNTEGCPPDRAHCGTWDHSAKPCEHLGECFVVDSMQKKGSEQ
jgi:hypothetical protein